MTKINDALNRLETMRAKSTNPINQNIYQNIIDEFGAEGSTLSLDQVVQMIGALAEKRNEIQEYRHVPNFFHSNGESRRAIVKSMIEKIMAEYKNQPDFLAKMEVCVKKQEARAQYLNTTPFGELRVVSESNIQNGNPHLLPDDESRSRFAKATEKGAGLLRETFDRVQQSVPVAKA